MSLLKHCWQNLLEASAVTLTEGMEESGYPLWRAYDRDIGRLFKAASLGNFSNSIDSYGEANQSGGKRILGAWSVGQIFIPAAGSSLQVAKFYLDPDPLWAGNLYAKLYAVAGTVGVDAVPTGAALATSAAVDAATLTGGYQLVTFTFAAPYALTPGTGYALVVEFPSAIDGYVGYDATSPSHAGNYVDDSSGAWAAVAGRDCIFYALASGDAYGIEVKVDQGATGAQAVDRLLIPAGHNLDGMDVEVLYSTDDAAYTQVATQAISGSGLINISFTEQTKRYWKVRIYSSGTLPQLAELFLTSTYTWPRNPARPAGPLDDDLNVLNEVTSAGADRFLLMGDPKRRRDYVVPYCAEAHKTAVKALYDGASALGKPFYLCDHEGTWIYGKLSARLNLSEVAYQTYSFDFKFLEVLA